MYQANLPLTSFFFSFWGEASARLMASISAEALSVRTQCTFLLGPVWLS